MKISQEFQKILKKDNSHLERYYNNIMAAGDFSAGHINGVFHYCSDYDLNNKYHRLIIAITIFSLPRDYYK